MRGLDGAAGVVRGTVAALVDASAEDALVGMIERGLGQAYRLARAILLDDAEAEDAVQDACLAAWRRRSSLRDRDSFGAWFDRIVINACRDQLRRRQRQRVRAIALQAEWIEGATRASDDETGVDRALDALDPEHRVVVVLRYWADLPLDGIAERVGVPTGTVKSRLHYALRAMRESLEASRG